MSFDQTKWITALGLCICLGALGCSNADSLSKAARTSTQLTLGSETPLTLEQAMQQCATLESFLVSLKVGAGKGDTFDAKSTEFLVSEIPDGEKATDPLHDPSTCPFCRKKAENAPTVVVRMLDSKGKTFPGSAEQIFDLKRGMHIVVKGSGVFDPELNTLTINATGLAKL
ncbi:MAG: hypothetical protein MUC43_06130 [Pirellula sp.]|jgi:hypothetical protein|nr:hypothetical protein [Pirellula sp.]